MNQEKLLSSYHIFLFPFKWKLNDKKSNPQNLDYICDKLIQQNWKRNSSTKQLKSASAYSEFVYFHPFAQEALYDVEGNDNIRQLVYKLPKNERLFYEIKPIKEKKITLEIENIYLNIYSTGIGILSYHLLNKQEKRADVFKDVLAINNLGRRIYPPFLGEKNDNGAIIPSADGAKSANLLPDFIAITKINQQSLLETSLVVEDFSAFTFSKIFTPPKFISWLFPERFFKDYEVEQILDDRMFVMSLCIDDDIITMLQKENTPDKYLQSKNWYRYLFVDGPKEKSLDNDIFQEKLLEKHTYPRWVGDGTIYGITRYSFMSITTRDRSWLSSHFKSMYYKMVELCLMQRASLLQFSKRIADITHEANPKENAERTARLNKNYLHFINNIHFTEITPQEQGIDLYNMLQNHLEIDRDRTELNQETQELHNYMNILAEGQRSEALEMLTILGALLVLPSFILGYYGLDGVLGDDFAHNWWKIKCVTVLVILVVIFSLGFSWYRPKPAKKIYSNISGIIALLLTLAAIYLPFSSRWDTWKQYEDNPTITNDTIRLGEPLIISIDSTEIIKLNPDNFYFIQPKQ